MRRYKHMVSILALLLALAGCRPTVDGHRPEDYGHLAASMFSTSFESFWQGMNMYYDYWSLEPQRYWDDVWDDYQPKFDSLAAHHASLKEAGNVTDAAFQLLLDEAHRYFTEFLAPLHDGHLTVQFNNALPVIRPAENRADARFADDLTADNNPKQAFRSTWSGTPFTGDEDYVNYNFWENTISQYMQDGSTKKSYYDAAAAANADIDPTSIFRIATGHIANSGGGFILYFYVSAFALKASAEPQVAAIITQYLNDIANPDLQGIIIDLRGNTGGATDDIALLLNRLIDRPLLFAYTRYKNGLNRLDYKPWTPYYINPYPDQAKRIQNNVPVVALVNNYSISCGEIAPLAIRAMPKGYLIGTKTYGATGPRVGNISPAVANGGAFLNIGGASLWVQVVQAGFQTTGADGVSYEGVGITPDEVIEFDWIEFRGDGVGSGRDRQLLAAIRHIDPAYAGP
jgi:C-terminal processing protease CtpA/Prc